MTEEVLEIVPYTNEKYLSNIADICAKTLSEPYNIFTFRYFLDKWSSLCFIALINGEFAGAIVNKLEQKSEEKRREGYIGMVAVEAKFRKRGIGKKLVVRSIEEMMNQGCDAVVLETEENNYSALSFYKSLGFIKTKYMERYYLNGIGAYKLVLPFTVSDIYKRTEEMTINYYEQRKALGRRQI